MHVLMLNCKSLSPSSTNNIADGLAYANRLSLALKHFLLRSKVVVITLMSSHNSASQQNYNFRYITFVSQSSNLATWRRAVVLYPLAHSKQRDLFVPWLNNLQTDCGCFCFIAVPHHLALCIKRFAAILHGVVLYYQRCYVSLKKVFWSVPWLPSTLYYVNKKFSCAVLTFCVIMTIWKFGSNILLVWSAQKTCR